MYCHNCGEELSPTASFCLKCGTLRSQIEQGFSAPTATEATSAEEQAFVSLTNKNLTIERTLSLVFGIAFSVISLMMLPLSFLLLATASDGIMLASAYTYLSESIMILAMGVVCLINVFSINKVRGCLYSDIKPAQKRYKSGTRSVIMFIFCTGPWVLHIINKKRFEACPVTVNAIAQKQRDGAFTAQENK
ncbi:MAG: zinc ribbon domain-containing protein [Clostridia bacterium]|nr:zinc ribbon domain-containing protein [Clostridia bacterium]